MSSHSSVNICKDEVENKKKEQEREENKIKKFIIQTHMEAVRIFVSKSMFIIWVWIELK